MEDYAREHGYEIREKNALFSLFKFDALARDFATIHFPAIRGQAVRQAETGLAACGYQTYYIAGLYTL